MQRYPAAASSPLTAAAAARRLLPAALQRVLLLLAVALHQAARAVPLQFSNTCDTPLTAAFIYTRPVADGSPLPEECPGLQVSPTDETQYECRTPWLTVPPGEVQPAPEAAVDALGDWWYAAYAPGGSPACAAGPGDLALTGDGPEIADCTLGQPGCYPWAAVRAQQRWLGSGNGWLGLH